MSDDRAAVRVLVVAEDSPTRDLVRDWLLESGYDVTIASNPTDALGTLSWRPARLVVSSRRLFHRGQMRLMRQISAKQPATKFVVLGEKDDPSNGAAELAGEMVEVLHQPFSLEQFREVIDRLCGRS